MFAVAGSSQRDNLRKFLLILGLLCALSSTAWASPDQSDDQAAPDQSTSNEMPPGQMPPDQMPTDAIAPVTTVPEMPTPGGAATDQPALAEPAQIEPVSTQPAVEQPVVDQTPPQAAPTQAMEPETKAVPEATTNITTGANIGASTDTASDAKTTADEGAAANSADWQDNPVDKQEALNKLLGSYINGSPTFTVYRGSSMYPLEWKTLLIDSGWTFAHYEDLHPETVGHGVTIRSNSDNEANARILMAAFEMIGIEPNYETADDSVQDIVLIIGKK